MEFNSNDPNGLLMKNLQCQGHQKRKTLPFHVVDIMTIGNTATIYFMFTL
jgi:hypothetical protein